MTKPFATPPNATPDDRAINELEAARTAAITRMRPSEVGENADLQKPVPAVGAGDRVEQDHEPENDNAFDEADIDVTLEEEEDPEDEGLEDEVLEAESALEQAPARMVSPGSDDKKEEYEEGDERRRITIDRERRGE